MQKVAGKIFVGMASVNGLVFIALLQNAEWKMLQCPFGKQL